MDIKFMTALESAAAVKNGDISAAELVSCANETIGSDPLNCFITRYDDALDRADAVQSGISSGRISSPVAGAVFTIKDVICHRLKHTTCASRMLQSFIPCYSAEAVTRLENAGAVILGKTNTDEFAMGSTTETSLFGATLNPIDPSRVPGGSSGGSAASVAAGYCSCSLGSDTGGSVRLPAAWCGVTGLKPTYGSISRSGLISFANSLDQIGIIAQTASDCLAVFDIISGADSADSTSMDSYSDPGCDFRADSITIGIPRELLSCADRQTVDAIKSTAAAFERLGARCEEISVPELSSAVAAYYIIACAEASSNLARYDGVKYGFRAPADTLEDMYRLSRSEGFGDEVKRRIMLGCFVLSSGYYDKYYLKAQHARASIKAAIDRALGKYDLLLSPVTGLSTPPLLSAPDNPLERYKGDLCTVPANLAGIPAISFPCAKLENGFSVGAQLMTRAFGEKLLTQAVSAVEGELK